MLGEYGHLSVVSLILNNLKVFGRRGTKICKIFVDCVIMWYSTDAIGREKKLFALATLELSKLNILISSYSQ